MPTSPYWNPHTETLPRDRLDALQLRKLRDLVAWTLEQRALAGRAPARPRASTSPDAIRSLDDVRRIPFLTRDEWMESQEADPPFGAVLAAPVEAAIRYHTTSGTAGSRPLAVLDGPKDWEWIAEMWCYALLGLRRAPRRTRCSSPSATARSSASGARSTRPRSSAASCCPAAT